MVAQNEQCLGGAQSLELEFADIYDPQTRISAPEKWRFLPLTLRFAFLIPEALHLVFVPLHLAARPRGEPYLLCSLVRDLICSLWFYEFLESDPPNADFQI
jgi:hypothetical protein